MNKKAVFFLAVIEVLLLVIAFTAGMMIARSSAPMHEDERSGAAASETSTISVNPSSSFNVVLPFGVKLEMVKCPAGSFIMGSPSNEGGRDNDEMQHRVTLTKDFYIGKYEVTQAQYRAVPGGTPSYFKGDERPVEQVSWHDAMKFCEKLNKLTEGKRPVGYKFSLPTEAQWEYACRAGTTASLNSGEDMIILGSSNSPNLDIVGWYGGNCGQDYNYFEDADISEWPEKQYNDSKGGTHPVGKKKPNAWGIYDMHGNVWEWCLDWKRDYPGDATDPTGTESGTERVGRGGSWSCDAKYCRSASRHSGTPDDRFGDLGFRVALVPIQ